MSGDVMTAAAGRENAAGGRGVVKEALALLSEGGRFFPGMALATRAYPWLPAVIPSGDRKMQLLV
jgi:hypothetical protein